jgi:hypothetical protein
MVRTAIRPAVARCLNGIGKILRRSVVVPGDFSRRICGSSSTYFQSRRLKFDFPVPTLLRDGDATAALTENHPETRQNKPEKGASRNRLIHATKPRLENYYETR